MFQVSKVERFRPIAKRGSAVTLFALLLLAFSPFARAGSSSQFSVGSFPASSAPLAVAGDPSVEPAIPPSPVGLWHLDETSGTTAFDSSGRGHNGAISGPVTLGVPGKVNTAYGFTPKSTVIVPDAPDLRPGTGRIVVSYFVKLTTPPPSGTDYDIFTKGDTTTSGGQIKLEVQRNGQASCMFRGSLGQRQLQAGPNVIDGKWHKVTCKRAGNQIVETVSGTSFSVTQATGAITNTAEVRIGSHLGGGDWYNGVLDEVSYAIG